MRKLCLILIATISLSFSKAQSNNFRIVLERSDTMHFERDSVFGFAINPSLKKSDSIWKNRTDAILNQFARVFKSRCEVENLSCNIMIYSPMCGWDASKKIHVVNNIKSYLLHKCGIPQKLLYSVMETEGGPLSIDFKGKPVPYIEIIISREAH